MDTPKGSLIIPKRFLGGLLKLLWNDVSFIYADSVDHTKVLQIAIKTCLGPSQTAHKRPQKTLRRRPATKISPQELLSEPYETTSGTKETLARPKDPLESPKGLLESSNMLQERYWTPQKGSQVIPKRLLGGLQKPL